MLSVSRVKQAYLKFGFASRRSFPLLTKRYHRHNEVELNFSEKGSISYLFGSGKLWLRPGEFAVFWGAVPHQIIQLEDNPVIHWLTIPLAWFLQWQLSEVMTQRILEGKFLVDQHDKDNDKSDFKLFNHWHQDLKTNSVDCRKVALLEVEARLRRFSLRLLSEKVTHSKKKLSRTADGQSLGKIEQMTSFIAENYTRHLPVTEIAKVVGLNPAYAVTLFRKTCGMSLVDYITEHRISHAQRLLAITDMKILDIAFESGFHSASRFYAAFSEACGKSPKAYRQHCR